MKKVLKLVLVLALALALAVNAFAATASKELGGGSSSDTPDEVISSSSSGSAGAAYGNGAIAVTTNAVSSASTNAGADTQVTVSDPTASYAAANLAAARELTGKTGVEILDTLSSFDVDVKQNGQSVHSGTAVTLTFDIPSQYVGKYLTIFENTNGVIRVAYSSQITSTPMTVTLTSFSTFTAVITDAPLQGATSPATSQSTLNVTLVCAAALALAAAAFAAKRRSEL